MLVGREMDRYKDRLFGVVTRLYLCPSKKNRARLDVFIPKKNMVRSCSTIRATNFFPMKEHVRSQPSDFVLTGTPVLIYSFWPG